MGGPHVITITIDFNIYRHHFGLQIFNKNMFYRSLKYKFVRNNKKKKKKKKKKSNTSDKKIDSLLKH